MTAAVPEATTRIPVSGPWITEREIRYVTDAVTHAWYSNAGCWHERFEKAFAVHLGVPFATALPSCTSAIHLSLAALGIGPGDEVIVPDITWIATVAPVHYVGATPVFADVDPETWVITAETLKDCLTSRSRAIIPVDLYGGMPDYEPLLRVAADHGLPVIEDAAEAVGSTYQGRPAGSLGATGVFSFHGSKTLTTGEGGLLGTRDEGLFRRVLHLRDHGREPGDRHFCNTAVGFKYKMSAMQAALGLAQLERVGDLVARKREIFGWYRERLANLPGVSLNVEPAYCRNSYWMVTAVWEREGRPGQREVQDALERRGIDSRPFFHPLSSLPAYRDHPQAVLARSRNRVAHDLDGRALNLPSALNLTEAQVDRVCREFRDVISRGDKGA
ncbi:MAG: DegT/DnrJ/EryC1/StrS family aminotransferase [Verrucomicrobiae bacterium]|nr:DegT/DnrJ/EryC1/StrS family aminotransferase [Verrucomicrobiae bacterium]